MSGFIDHPLAGRYLPRALRKHASSLDREKKRARMKWKRRSEQDRPMGAKIKLKHTYRVRAYTEKGHLTFWKTRTKLPITTIKRLLARGNMTADRITV